MSFAIGIDPSLQAAAARGDKPRARFRHIFLLLPGFAITFCLTVVHMVSVFPRRRCWASPPERRG